MESQGLDGCCGLRPPSSLVAAPPLEEATPDDSATEEGATVGELDLRAGEGERRSRELDSVSDMAMTKRYCDVLEPSGTDLILL